MNNKYRQTEEEAKKEREELKERINNEALKQLVKTLAIYSK